MSNNPPANQVQPVAAATVAAALTVEAVAADYFSQLHGQCEAVSKQSLAGSNLTAVAESYQFVSELVLWCDALGSRREVELVRVAALEYDFGLLGLVQGHYRPSFKSLRLVLELIMQAVFLSANELRLREWLSNKIDTDWGAILNKQDGVFSERFSKGFFPGLETHSPHIGGMASLLYRECSEAVHGNVPKHIPLPPKLGFDQQIFALWHAKAKILRLVVQYALTLRHLGDLTDVQKKALAPCFAHVTHIPQIKAVL